MTCRHTDGIKNLRTSFLTLIDLLSGLSNQEVWVDLNNPSGELCGYDAVSVPLTCSGIVFWGDGSEVDNTMFDTPITYGPHTSVMGAYANHGTLDFRYRALYNVFDDISTQLATDYFALCQNP